MVVIALMAVLAGANGPTAIAQWANDKKDLLQGLLPLPNGIPQKDVYRRVLSALKPEAFQACFGNWLRSVAARKFRATTDSNHARPVAENALNQEFDTASRPNEVWLADITYMWTEEGWLSLAAVEDLSTRKVVGWSMAARMKSELVRDALRMAIGRELPGAGLVAHSDRGSQYASEAYQSLLQEYGITCSMSRRGNCYDNAPMESFFATLKKERIHQVRYRSRAEARADIFGDIESFYNRVRRHSALGYVSPVCFAEAA